MVVGICRLELSLPDNGSLKGKRSVVRRIVDRTANRFNVAIAEVDHLDGLQRATLGFSVVSNETSHANSMIDSIVGFVEDLGGALIVGRDMEMVHFGREMHASNGDWEDFADDS